MMASLKINMVERSPRRRKRTVLGLAYDRFPSAQIGSQRFQSSFGSVDLNDSRLRFVSIQALTNFAICARPHLAPIHVRQTAAGDERCHVTIVLGTRSAAGPCP
jgi:hypothetical protein